MQTTSRQQNSSWPTILAVGIVAITGLMYFIAGLVGEQTVSIVVSITTVISAVACAVLCFILWRSFNKGELLKTVWGWLTVSLVLWAIAEVIYAVYQHILQVDIPYPSLADAVWVPGYIVLFIGLYLRYRSLRLTPSRMQVVIATVGFVAFLAVSVIFVILPTISSNEGVSPIEQFLNIAYPAGDLLTVLGATLILMVMLGGQLSRPWLFIGLGYLITAVSDTLYSYGTITGEYGPINFVTGFTDTTYVAGYVLIALGLYTQARIQHIL
jgi:hypothetical protein